MARVAARRLPDMAAEGGAERARRTVADAARDLIERQGAAAEQVLGDSHPPGQQIFHRAQADRAGEAVEEGGAGHAGGIRQPGHRPAMLRATMHLAQRLRQPGIRKAPQQTGRRIPAARYAQRFDQQDFHKPRQHKLPPDILRLRLLALGERFSASGAL